MIFDAEFFYTAYEEPGVFRPCRRQDAMSQIKYVPRAVAIALENPVNMPSDPFFVREKHTRVQITLQGLAAKFGSQPAEVQRPVGPDNIAIQFAQLRRIIDALGKDNDWRPMSSSFGRATGS